MTTVTLHEIRHSASHVLAQAMLQVFPDAKLGIGPVIDDGFYYDFELPRSLTDADLTDLEKRMKRIIKQNQTFTCHELTKQETIDRLTTANQPYKLELVDDLNESTYTFWENGPFVDLCKGPHVRHTGQIKAVKLLRTSGAYWRGSEKNPMLQRVYGTAFQTADELAAYIEQQEQAQRRDHRMLGKALDLFSIQDQVGGGLVLWHPKGALIRHLLEQYWKEAHFKSGYDLVNTPHIGQSRLWETSGHLQFYESGMFSKMSYDNHDYFVKPMNCPFHILIYKNKARSYRELPLRWAELGTVYRNERSGVLHGLMRVRGFTQDDAHIMCTAEQVTDEIKSVLQFCLSVLKQFGFHQFKVFLSTRPAEKSVGESADWELAQSALETAIKDSGLPYEIDEGGGAFYGPKIDIKISDAIGREWQCSTIQFDFNLPERFDMTYIGSDGQKHRPLMIHRALLGSIERFFGILIEHYEGKFPFWLAPVQAKVLTVNAACNTYAKTVRSQLEANGYRVELDESAEKIGYKIRQATLEKVPYMIIIGQNEEANQAVSIRCRNNGDLGQVALADITLT